MEFNNESLGKCIILKDCSKRHKLVYSLKDKEFILAHGIDFENEMWDGAEYYGKDLDGALKGYNQLISEELDNER